MRARSRSPATLSVAMDSINCRAWSSLSTGVLPVRTTCLGIWTDGAGLPPSDPPETSQSKHLLMADRCCLTDGRDRGRWRALYELLCSYDSNVLESSKSTIITTFMIVLLREVSAEGILRGGPRVSRAA